MKLTQLNKDNALYEADMSVAKVLDQIDDIMSSGTGGGMDDWHEKSLTALIKPLPDQTKRAVFKAYAENIVDQEGWEIEEVQLIGKLCGAKNIQLEITYN